ncbi:LSM domain, eukaryotic/archaea-type,LSM domain,Sm-like protein Lsm4 [Cinara cedri]|uniref:U6 snRNA-associated Sm-like protein LSm4 n=1 Tax=Cinara cedri TaxID=506608 RepID=A0A5E4NNL1_9HEMI|nr:LSM domain, eukaryotic/archaea-type,LSM domain,Sm-like protein Lsm4 [Cinara cedri]
MLPLGLLKAVQGLPLLLELKNGETYNGILVACDSWMNIKLKEVVCTSADGDNFIKLPECFIRGCKIKYMQIPDEVFNMVLDDQKNYSSNQGHHGKGGGNNKNYRSARSFNRGGTIKNAITMN